MGFWNSDLNGGIARKGESDCVWGDTFADIIDAALIEIKAEFEVVVGRPATDEDIRRGLSFAIGEYLRPVNENSEEEE
jgi:hypothetical protein|tara:strand:+ start:52 stop:285 length:234 start_codon:yes stop_codon:yes gene_type:complete